MKPILRTAPLAVTCILALAACSPGATDETAATTGPVPVVTTFSVLADVVRNVGAGLVEVHSMVPMGTDPHEYQPLPEDVQRATDADLLVWNGLDMETGDGWFASLVDVAGKDFDGHEVAELAAGVEPRLLTDGDTEEVNPHAFLSPRVGLVYTENAIDALSAVDPEHAAEYERNGEAYLAKIRSVEADYAAAFGAVPAADRVLVTSERAFQYLAADYGLAEGYLWEIDTDEQGTPDQILSLVEFVRTHRPRGLLVETNVDARAMETVSQETGVPIVAEVYSDELGPAGSEAETYLDYLRYNLSVMIEAMSPR